MQARYSGQCNTGKDTIKVGDDILAFGRGWTHRSCLLAKDEQRAGSHDYRACEEFDGEPHTAEDHQRMARTMAAARRYVEQAVPVDASRFSPDGDKGLAAESSDLGLRDWPLRLAVAGRTYREAGRLETPYPDRELQAVVYVLEGPAGDTQRTFLKVFND